MPEPERTTSETETRRAMRWASVVSQAPRLPAAVEELSLALREGLGGGHPDLVLAFVSAHHRGQYDAVAEELLGRLEPRVLLGCSAAGVVGGGRELEEGPAVALMGAALPDVALHPFHVDVEDLPSPDAGPSAWEEALGVPRQPTPHFLLLGEPATSDPVRLLAGLDYAYPGATKLGGLASTGGRSALFLDRATLASGTAGVALEGNLILEPIVAQGARPVGEPLRITGCQQNLLLELDGRRPTDVLAEIYEQLDPMDRSLLEGALLIGIASTALIGDAERPEFVVRNVLGADPQRGILAVGASLRLGQTVRFYVRDAAAADEDLSRHLGRYAARGRDTEPAGALLFSCAGRGHRLYGCPDHDSRAFRDELGPLPLGGFFCAGEIGPVGGDTRLLGYTSAFGIARPKVQ